MSVVLAALATVAGFFGSVFWLLDLFAHFRVQYIGGFAGLGLICLLAKQRRLAGVCATGLLVNIATLWPLVAPHPARQPANAKPSRWMTFNVHTSNPNKDAVIAEILSVRPDVVALQEVDSTWMDALQRLKAEYPFVVAEPREDNFGICLFSRWPVVSSAVCHWGAAEVPSLEVHLQTPPGTVTAIATHPLPPVGRRGSAARDEQLALLAEHIRNVAGPVVVMGDLNTTPWGASFRRLLRQSGLHDTARGFGWQPTWPAFQPLLFIPLDHVLVSRDVSVGARRAGEAAGSDHCPVIVELLLPPSQTALDRQ